jgi:hypothetical protein
LAVSPPANPPSWANLTDAFATLVTTSVPIPTPLEVAKDAAASRTLRARAAPAFELTPALQQRLSDTARRTLHRRWMERAASVISPPEIDAP